jgi:hypothetical protein
LPRAALLQDLERAQQSCRNQLIKIVLDKKDVVLAQLDQA